MPRITVPMLALLILIANPVLGQEATKPQPPVKDGEIEPPKPKVSPDEKDAKPQAKPANEAPRPWRVIRLPYGLLGIEGMTKDEEKIKPLPPTIIPDDPPPHEGSMIDIPVTLEPPDVIELEVLESLPGRPISGDRLVEPDGNINLGFYGKVHVRGLTIEQAKEKIVLHMREYLGDEVLGLITHNEVTEIEVPTPPNTDFELLPPPVKPERSTSQPEAAGNTPEAGLSNPPGFEKTAKKRAARKTEKSRTKPGVALKLRKRQTISRTPMVPTAVSQDPQPSNKVASKPAEDSEKPLDQAMFGIVAPADSNRVFVRVNAYNSKVYFVQGDVGVPGRLPCTGKETVLDALNFAGNLLPTAEPEDIYLYRPARGGQPAKGYKIDYQAILKGVATANLQILPDDRLVVGRNAIVQRTMAIDRAAAPINSVWNALFQQNLTTRYVGSVNNPMSGGSSSLQVKVNGQNVAANPADLTTLSPAQRDALIKAEFEFLFAISSKENGATLDEAKFRELLMKKLSIPSPTPPEAK